MYLSVACAKCLLPVVCAIINLLLACRLCKTIRCVLYVYCSVLYIICQVSLLIVDLLTLTKQKFKPLSPAHRSVRAAPAMSGPHSAPVAVRHLSACIAPYSRRYIHTSRYVNDRLYHFAIYSAILPAVCPDLVSNFAEFGRAH